MKFLNRKVSLILNVILIALCSFFILQWNKEKIQSDRLYGVKEQQIFNNFTNLTKELNGIAETLHQYDEGFTDQEKELFRQSIGKDMLMLNKTGMNLLRLSDQTALDGLLIYEHYIWKIEKMLEEFLFGKISDENDIHSIGNIIKKHNEQLTDMFYGEEQIGLEGINKKEEIMKIIELIDLMNKEISEVTNK